MVKSKGTLKEEFGVTFPNESDYSAEDLRNALWNIVDSYKDEIRTLSQSEIDAIVSPQTKDMVFNSDTNCLQVYVGAWLNVLLGKSTGRADEIYFAFEVTFDGESGSGAEGTIVLPEMFVPASYVCYQTIWSATGMDTGAEVIAFGVDVDASNNIFSKDLDEIDEESTKVETPTGNLTKTATQRRIVGSVAGGDITQGKLSITTKFMRV